MVLGGMYAAATDVSGTGHTGLRENVYGHVARLDFLRGFLRPTDRILDFGCGTGIMTTLPLKAQGWDIIGLDRDSCSIDYGRGVARERGLDPACLVAEDLADHSGVYDVVIASEVLEHLDDETLAKIVPQLRDRLKPGGRLFVTVPNGYGWFELESRLYKVLRLGPFLARSGIQNFIERAKRRLVGPFVDSDHVSTFDASPHVQAFTYASIKSLLRRNDLRITAARGSTWFAGPISNLLFTGLRPVMGANLWLGKVGPCLSSGFWIVAEKPGE